MQQKEQARAFRMKSGPTRLDRVVRATAKMWLVWGLLGGVMLMWATGCRQDPVKKSIQELRSGDPVVRAKATLKLARLGARAEPAVGPLIGALKDKDKRVVLGAIRALGAIGVRAIPARLPLQALRKKVPPPVKKQIDQALQAIMKSLKKRQPKPAELAAVIKANKSLSAVKRALVRLGQQKQKSRPYVPLMIRQLDHKEKSVRGAASTGILLLGPEVALPVLKTSLDAKSSRLRNNILRTIGLFGPFAVPLLDVLFKYAQAKEPKIRRASLWALSRLWIKSKRVKGPNAQQTEKAITFVSKALKDPEWSVRGAAYMAYGRLTHQTGKGADVLRQGLRDAHAHVRYVSLDELVVAGKVSKEDIVLALKDTSHEIRERATRLISVKLFGDEALKLLRQSLQSKSWRQRASALSAIAANGANAKPLLADVKKLLSDPKVEVRKLALRVYLQLQRAKAAPSRPAPSSRPTSAASSPASRRAPAKR